MDGEPGGRRSEGRAESHGRIEMTGAAADPAWQRPAGPADPRVPHAEGLRGAVADRLGDAAEALYRAGRSAEEKGGAASRVAPLAYRVADGVGDTAEYVNATEPGAMRADLEVTVRSNPIRSVLVAAAAGFVLGRLLR